MASRRSKPGLSVRTRRNARLLWLRLAVGRWNENVKRHAFVMAKRDDNLKQSARCLNLWGTWE